MRTGIGKIADISCVIMVIFHFWVERCQKYRSNPKKFQIKVVGIEFCPKKSANAYVYLPPGVELGGSKDVPSIILKGNSKLQSLSE